MKIVKKLAAIAVSSLMMFSLAGVHVYAKDFDVSITSNKTEYSNDEKATIHIVAQNNSEEDFYNVSLEAVVPDGLTVVDSNTSAFAEDVEAGNKISVDLTVEKSGTESSQQEESSKEISDKEGSGSNSSDVSESSNSKQGTDESSIINSNNDSPKTGDNSNTALICLLVSFSLIVICFLVYKSKKLRKIVTLILCLSIVSTPILLMQNNVKSANEENFEFYSEILNIKFDGEYYKIEANLSFSSSFKDAIDEYEIDTDSDGIPDIMEKQLGLNPNKDDTDDDRLTDYFEFVNAVTDPKTADTDENGISDFDEDNDNDGLKNGEEQATGTYVFNKDSDNDGLTDGDEVHKYSTDPMEKDTDGDGLTDYEEVKLGLDPLKMSTDGSVNDFERKLPQTASDEVKDDALKESDNWLIPQISGNISGLLGNQVLMRKNESLSFNDNHSILSDIIEIDLSCDSALNLTFFFKENYTGNPEQLVIAYYDNDAHELHLVDSHLSDEQDKIEGEITSSGYYFVMDIDEFLKSIGIDVMNNITDTSEKITKKSTSTSVSTYTSASTDSSIGKADIVFVVDTTGSMSDAIYNVQSNINTFADKMSNEYHVDMNYSLIEYRDIDEDGVASTIVHNNLSSRWFTNVNTFKSEVSSLTVDGGGDVPETPIDALELARTSNWRNGATRFVVLVTDVYSKNNNTSGIKDMDEMAKRFASDGIIVSVITDNRSDYESMLDQTHGLYGDIYSDFSDILLQLAGIIGTETHEGGDWIMLDDYSIVQLKGSVDDIATIDSDEDGFKDSDELIRKTTIDVKPLVMVALALCGVPMEHYVGKSEIEVWKFISNPTLPDTDYDGLDDSLDTEPRNSSVHSFVIYESNDDEAGLQKQKTYNGNDSRRAEDFQYADKTHDQLCDMDYIWWGDVLFPAPNLYLLHMREFPPLVSVGDPGMIIVGQEMISHFADGTGTDYRNDTLTNRIENHENTQKYANAVEDVFKEVLKENNGNLGKLMYCNTDGMRKEYSEMVRRMNEKIDEGNEDLFQPSYPDKFNGLGITVDGLYGNQIEVTSYNLSGNHYTAKLHYVMYDVYGLDKTDITDEYIDGFKFGLIDCFRAWYILQHWDTFDGDYKPYITFMEFDRVVEGDL